MGKIEIDAKLWIEICSTIGYAQGVCESVTAVLNTELTLEAEWASLRNCAEKLQQTWDNMNEAFDD